jgi:hypothetical protein
MRSFEMKLVHLIYDAADSVGSLRGGSVCFARIELPETSALSFIRRSRWSSILSINSLTLSCPRREAREVVLASEKMAILELAAVIISATIMERTTSELHTELFVGLWDKKPAVSAWLATRSCDRYILSIHHLVLTRYRRAAESPACNRCNYSLHWCPVQAVGSDDPCSEVQIRHFPVDFARPKRSDLD